jgi:hypothetical protein
MFRVKMFKFKYKLKDKFTSELIIKSCIGCLESERNKLGDVAQVLLERVFEICSVTCQKI